VKAAALEDTPVGRVAVIALHDEHVASLH
jgi:hypothetical protein